MKKYLVRLCYSGYAEFKVEADSMVEAHIKAEQKDIENGMGENLDHSERWEEADIVLEIKEEFITDSKEVLK